MERKKFLKLLNEFLDKTGMSCGSFNKYFSAGDEKDINTTIYVDEENNIWLTGDESIIRVKTSINIKNVIEFRYGQFGRDGGRFFIICDDNSGLDFCEGEIGFFVNGYYGEFKDALEYFTENPVV